MLEVRAGAQHGVHHHAACMQVLHVAGVAILDDAAREATEEAAAAASRQAEQAAEGGDDAAPRLSRKEEKRQRRAERAAKLAQAARNGLPNGVSGELQVSIKLHQVLNAVYALISVMKHDPPCRVKDVCQCCVLR